ncbi:beta-glucosidase 45-like isoform X2 [Cucurbita moschata]|uniref:Beta-glucosidase 45-like isoform X2 n=1 Tax=Cucurbita moschata TaxID=3662 RepID=A0A6J1GSD9_CUCMO|nr:beta-glucosidase 45-like isoform X2 [Cucurbita moschata]
MYFIGQKPVGRALFPVMEFSLAFLAILLLVSVFFSTVTASSSHVPIEETTNSKPLPNNFLFGTASSAYQFEGAFLSDGKGLSNWDVFTHKPGNIEDETNGDIAVDHYHRYLEDLDLMAFIGVNSYRFSISWARILPRIEPFVTLTHYDIPQELEDRYGAWLNPQVQEDFRYYADICFKSFGDRVKYWVTFNEPNVQVIRGYRKGTFPPSRCSSSFGKCKHGDSAREPLVAAHNIILSHAAAVNTYRSKYQAKQGGVIGVVINAVWHEPISDSFEDISAAERAHSFYMNWFLDPIIFGYYPAEMEEILGFDLPRFSTEDQKKLKNGADFIGINHYTSFYVKDCLYSACEPKWGSSKIEGFALCTPMKEETSIGEPTEISWIYVYPQGMNKIVTYIKERYNNIPIFVTENGYGEKDKPNTKTEDLLNDTRRADYMSSYLGALETSMREGADVRGYFAWSLLDNFEWISGYTERFGLCHVDYATLKRTPKFSAFWYKNFIAQNLMGNNVSAVASRKVT